MGNDLLLNFVWWAKDKRPDWDAARAYIENLTEEQLKDHPEFEYMQMIHSDDDDCSALEELKHRLLCCHDDIRSVADGNYDRHCYMINIGKYDVLITGGDSWGDSPSDMFDTIQDWGNLPGLPEFGFFPDWQGYIPTATNIGEE
jgi:hypothetical protein